MELFTRSRLNFSSLFESGRFSDVVIMAEDELDPGSAQSIRAHKIILAAGSGFFDRMFRSEAGSGLSIVYLAEIGFKPLQHCIEFIYKGEARVDAADIPAFTDLFNRLEMRAIEGEKSADNAHVAIPVPVPSTSAGIKKEEPNQDLDDMDQDLDKDLDQDLDQPKKKPKVSAGANLPYNEKVKLLVKKNPETGASSCSVCKKEFTSNQVAINHVKTKHLPRADFPCPYCDRMFKTSNLKSMHIHRKHHDDHKVAKVFGPSESQN